MKSKPSLTGTIELDLPEFDTPPSDPMPLVADWVERAEQLGVLEPYNAALATVGADGRVSNRFVLAKLFDASGILFATNASSRKGHEISETGHGAMVLFWQETRQQLRFVGSIERVSSAVSDEIWFDRPIASQASAVASEQSAPLGDEAAFRAHAAELSLATTPFVRPDDWGGYRLTPDEVEFWHGQPNRLHRRLRYLRTADGWTHERLQP
ncbi:MAG TPA: pyridoxamine 5'-phosphate oxidase [Terrimesophilobacter sp.]|nr:pyridoxamine 5'-phosphate oxidase [Terrimesophilobacter sp.]HRP99695.1 pyridoxamine 5'-phosphate oxidase [Terrimesophilobacter sp.]